MKNDKWVVIRHIDDEETEITLEGKDTSDPIAYATHDEHGWAGIELATDMAERFAKALGLKIEYFDGDEDK